MCPVRYKPDSCISEDGILHSHRRENVVFYTNRIAQYTDRLLIRVRSLLLWANPGICDWLLAERTRFDYKWWDRTALSLSKWQFSGRIASSGMLRHVALVRRDVSEELSASIVKVTRIGELGTTLAVTLFPVHRMLRRNAYFFAARFGC
jgi:hypothetical protein